jgi:pantothenate kinase
MDEKISMMMGQPMTRISSSAETTEEKNSNNSNNQMDHESSSAVPAVVLVSIHEDEQKTLQEQRLKMLKRKSERLCCGIFGSVIISLIIFSVVLSKYQNQIVDIITNRKEAGVDLWVILWFLAFVSTQPVFPGAT